MLKNILLTRFRCYELHSFDFKEITIIIGKNNAGKSTLIEALRLVSLVRDKLETGRYKSAPKWTPVKSTSKGISPSLKGIGFSYKNIVTQHEEPPSIIKVNFVTGESIEIFLSEGDGVFAIARNKEAELISSNTDAKKTKFPYISILPQISPLQKEENALDLEYVKSSIYSSLASRHFRNQLSYFNQFFTKFKQLSESSWHTLRIIQLIKAEKKFDVTNPQLFVQEGFFATEIGDMGHGLQMWLQTMWFLSRVNTNSTVVLDEPDVYMHADLQRKLIRLVKSMFKQVVIATHSLEIMTEVEPQNILVVDRRTEKSYFATDMPSVQYVIYNDIGSVHNLGLSRLWSAKKFLWVEGTDIAILRRLHTILFPQSHNPIDKIPSSDMGGWGGWKHALGSVKMLKNAGGESLSVYCIFDSDYHIPPDIIQRSNEAEKNNINLHIWRKKELENYLLHPEVIYRTAIKNNPKAKTKLSVEKITTKLKELCTNIKRDIEDDFSSEIMKFYRREKDNKIIDFMDSNKKIKYENKNANKLARRYVNSRWDDKISIAPGKKIIRELNSWLNDVHKCNVNAANLAIEFKEHEIDKEMKHVLTSIENITPF